MGGVQLDAVEARALDDGGGGREAIDDVEDLRLGERVRRDRSRHLRRERARGDRMGAGDAERLAARMVELHPHLCAAGLSGRRPAPQAVEVTVVLDDDVARLADVAAIDHHVAGEQQARAARAPRPIQLRELRRRPVMPVAELLAHRGLRDPVGEHRAAGEGERTVERRRVGDGCRQRRSPSLGAGRHTVAVRPLPRRRPNPRSRRRPVLT